MRSTAELEPGKSIIIKFLTIGEPDEDGTREVFFELNGQPRSVRVADRSLKSVASHHVKADPDQPGQVAAPMPGKVSAWSCRLASRSRRATSCSASRP
jgi:pyruvate carboxylase